MPTPQQLIGDDPRRVADRLQLMLSYLLTTPRDVVNLPISAGTALEGKTRAGTSYTQRFFSDLGSNARRFERDVPGLGSLARFGESIGQSARDRLQPSVLEEFLLGMAVPGGPRRPKGDTEKLLKEMADILAPRNTKLPIYRMEQEISEEGGRTPLQRAYDTMHRSDDPEVEARIQREYDRATQPGPEGHYSPTNPYAMGQPEPPSGSIPVAEGRRRTSQRRELRQMRGLHRSILGRQLSDDDVRYIVQTMETPEFDELVASLSGSSNEFLRRRIAEVIHPRSPRE